MVLGFYVTSESMSLIRGDTFGRFNSVLLSVLMIALEHANKTRTYFCICTEYEQQLPLESDDLSIEGLKRQDLTLALMRKMTKMIHPV